MKIPYKHLILYKIQTQYDLLIHAADFIKTLLLYKCTLNQCIHIIKYTYSISHAQLFHISISIVLRYHTIPWQIHNEITQLQHNPVDISYIYIDILILNLCRFSCQVSISITFITLIHYYIPFH